MNRWILIAALSFLPTLLSAQTPTPTCPGTGTQFSENFSNSSGLNDFDYWGNHWSPETASSLYFAMTGGELTLAPPISEYTFILVKDSIVPHTTADVVLEGDFKMDTGPGVFGLVFRADAAVSQAYMFQWNGMNGKWEIEKKKYGYPGFSAYDYVAQGNPIPNYVYGTWVHLRAVVGPGNSFSGYADLNDGQGERLVFSGVSDTYPSPPPYTEGAVGLRFYEVSASNAMHMDNFQVNGCPNAPPLDQGEGRVFPSPAHRGPAKIAVHMKESGRMECRIWNGNGELASKVVVQRPSGDQTVTLDLSGFAPGVYFYSLLLTYDSGKVEHTSTKKFAVIP